MGAPNQENLAADINVQSTTTERLPSSTRATSNVPKAKSNRGFAGMDPERQRQIASMGGKAAHAIGHAHEYTSETGRAAGKKRHSNTQRPNTQ